MSGGGLEEFDRVSGWVFQQDLLTPDYQAGLMPAWRMTGSCLPMRVPVQIRFSPGISGGVGRSSARANGDQATAAPMHWSRPVGRPRVDRAEAASAAVDVRGGDRRRVTAEDLRPCRLAQVL